MTRWEAERQLSKAFGQYTKQAEAVALQLASTTKWTYEGIDATPVLLGDRSIAGAIESFTGAPFGAANGTLTAARIITRAVQSTTVKRIGYSGLMIPILEDILMARRWAEGTSIWIRCWRTRRFVPLASIRCRFRVT